MKRNEIKALVSGSSIDRAICLLGEALDQDPQSDFLHYQLGNAYRRKAYWREAIEHYLKAVKINPASEACEAYRQVIDILNFYHRAVYGQ